MHCHPNARRTPRGRADLFLAVEAGMTVTATCATFGVSRRCYYRWLPRWRAQGRAGLVDRSSRPHTSPRRLGWLDEAAIGALRRLFGWGPDRIAPLVGCAPSTAHRALDRAGLIERPTERERDDRYEYERPGGLLHLDTKKLGRIVGGPGHRATGSRKGRRKGAGWELMHAAIDDASRLVYAEILPDQKKGTTTRFTLRALRWFHSQGVRVERVLTDNGSPYRSRTLRAALRRLRIKHQRTRPYRPRTNGKVERSIRTVLTECRYLEVFVSSHERRLALARYIGYYNDRRPHLGIGGRTPRQRLRAKQAAV